MLKNWIETQHELLELEYKYETELYDNKIKSCTSKECQSLGLTLNGLVFEEVNSALFGRCRLSFRRFDKQPLISSFKVGDEVEVYNPRQQSTNSEKILGVVSRTSNHGLDIVVEQFEKHSDFEAPQLLRLNLVPSQKTFTKMKYALNALVDNKHPLVEMLFTSSTDILPQQVRVDKISLDFIWNRYLNESQLNAIRCSLGSSHISIIHGPPGTGKTSTLTELILQLSIRKMKVLVCAPSNVAVDTILYRLGSYNTSKPFHIQTDISNTSNESKNNPIKLNMIRIGHPARMNPVILKYSLDYLINGDEGTAIVQDIRKEISDIREILDVKKSNDKKKWLDKTVRKEKRNELRQLNQEVRKREKLILKDILKRSNIVLATCIGAASNVLSELDFDVVIIDEAAQALEASCWLPILKGKRVVLAGDHCQLAPTIKNATAEKKGLGVTLFERIIQDKRFASVVNLLNVQYRMNGLISDWASNAMYHNQLTSDKSVVNHSVEDILMKPSVGEKKEEEGEVISVLLLVDTQGCGMEEDHPTDYTATLSNVPSHKNIHEADLVHKHVLHLVKCGVRPSDIGVITPYTGQLELLRSMLICQEDNDSSSIKSAKSSSNKLLGQIPCGYALDRNGDLIPLLGIEVKTIDSFQGGEKECILLSLVRSNVNHEVGFLSDSRRINVAVTRAKRHLAVFCDTGTCRTDSFIKSLLDHMSLHGDHVNAEDFLNEFHAMRGSLSHPVQEVQQKNITSLQESLKAVHEKVELNTENTSKKAVFMENDYEMNGKKILVSSSEVMIESTETAAGDEYEGDDKFHDNEEVSEGMMLETKDSKDQTMMTKKEGSSLMQKDGMGIDRNDMNLFNLQKIRQENLLQKKINLHSHHPVVEMSKSAMMKPDHLNQFQSTPMVEIDFLSFLKDFQKGLIIGGEVEVNAILGYARIKKNKTVPTTKKGTTSQSHNKKTGQLQHGEEMGRCLIFPTTLTSFQRMQIHSLCEDLSLTHCSIGEGKDRYIRVSLPALHEEGPLSEENVKTMDSVTMEKGKDTKVELMREPTMKDVEPWKEMNEISEHVMEPDIDIDIQTSQSMKNIKTKKKIIEMIDEDALLEAAIQSNLEWKHQHQYRITSTQPLANPEKISNQQKLREKLNQSQINRKPSSSNSNETKSSNNSNSSSNGTSEDRTTVNGLKHHKKVLKKPIPNFGGGKLGNK